ncbi:hypothetical protein T484DRAFT_1752770, partial [Baffinella frigidus]
MVQQKRTGQMGVTLPAAQLCMDPISSTHAVAPQDRAFAACRMKTSFSSSAPPQPPPPPRRESDVPRRESDAPERERAASLPESRVPAFGTSFDGIDLRRHDVVLDKATSDPGKWTITTKLVSLVGGEWDADRANADVAELVDLMKKLDAYT